MQISILNVKIQAELLLKTRDKLNKILSENTGKPIEQIEKDTDRDYWLTAEEAMNYGLVGKIITNRSEITTD